MSFKNVINIAGQDIGHNCPVYLVAEMSANHGQDYGRAVDILHAAKESGADAVKLQTYTADTLTLDCKSDNFYINEGPWQGQYLYDLYKKAYMPWDWHEKLKCEADRIGITLFSAPFDSTAISLLQDLDCPAYKIASPELIDLDLIRLAAETGKPVIISTGSGTESEIQEAVDVVRESGNDQLCLLKCTSEYPAPFNKMNLKTIDHLSRSFSCIAGLSDHSLGVSVPIASVALGAKIIEKHFILSREDSTVDSFFSITPDEFRLMAQSVREVEQAVGMVSYPQRTDDKRRSVFAVKDIPEGKEIVVDDVKNLRPGRGEILPKDLSRLIGRVATRKIRRGEAMGWDMVKM